MNTEPSVKLIKKEERKGPESQAEVKRAVDPNRWSTADNISVIIYAVAGFMTCRLVVSPLTIVSPLLISTTLAMRVGSNISPPLAKAEYAAAISEVSPQKYQEPLTDKLLAWVVQSERR